MAVESIIEGVTEYFLSCPMLSEGAFRIDALGDEATEYVITVGSFDPVIERYLDGSSDMRYQFTFGSREPYDMDRVQNISNSTFYEQFSDWLLAQEKKKIFPAMPAGCHPETIRAIGSGFLFDESGETARYQIQCELTYLKDAP